MPPQHTKRADDLGELLEILSHPQRRRVFTLLSTRNPRDGDEFDLEALMDGDDEIISLVHNHLPKLTDAGFIEWDRDRLVVARGPRFHEIAPLVDLMVAHEDELPVNWL